LVKKGQNSGIRKFELSWNW